MNETEYDSSWWKYYGRGIALVFPIYTFYVIDKARNKVVVRLQAFISFDGVHC